MTARARSSMNGFSCPTRAPASNFIGTIKQPIFQNRGRVASKVYTRWDCVGYAANKASSSSSAYFATFDDLTFGRTTNHQVQSVCTTAGTSTHEPASVSTPHAIRFNRNSRKLDKLLCIVVRTNCTRSKFLCWKWRAASCTRSPPPTHFGATSLRASVGSTLVTYDNCGSGVQTGYFAPSECVNIAPSKAWERRMRCRDTTLKPFEGTSRVEVPSGSA